MKTYSAYVATFIFLAFIANVSVLPAAYAGVLYRLDRATAPDTRHRSKMVVLRGKLSRRMTVSYRSPYILTTREGEVYEIRQSNRIKWDQLDSITGKTVELTGIYVVIPSQKAPKGSEAASRFVGGIIPELRYIKALEIREIPDAR